MAFLKHIHNDTTDAYFFVCLIVNHFQSQKPDEKENCLNCRIKFAQSEKPEPIEHEKKEQELLTFSYRHCETLVSCMGLNLDYEFKEKYRAIWQNKKINSHFFFCIFEIDKNKNKYKIKGRLQHNKWQGNDFLKEYKKKVELGKKWIQKITKDEKEVNEMKHAKDDNIFISFEIVQCSLHLEFWNPLDAYNIQLN